jgi:hypothetical protein
MDFTAGVYLPEAPFPARFLTASTQRGTWSHRDNFGELIVYLPQKKAHSLYRTSTPIMNIHGNYIPVGMERLVNIPVLGINDILVWIRILMFPSLNFKTPTKNYFS